MNISVDVSPTSVLASEHFWDDLEVHDHYANCKKCTRKRSKFVRTLPDPGLPTQRSIQLLSSLCQLRKMSFANTQSHNGTQVSAPGSCHSLSAGCISDLFSNSSLTAGCGSSSMLSMPEVPWPGLVETARSWPKRVPKFNSRQPAGFRQCWISFGTVRPEYADGPR